MATRPPTPSTAVATGSSSPYTIEKDELGRVAKSKRRLPGRGSHKPVWGAPPKTEKNWASLRKRRGGGAVKVTHQKTECSILPQVGPAYNPGQSHDDKRAP